MKRLSACTLLAPLLALALFGPLLVQADPLRQDLMAALSPPGSGWLLGADDLGRSVLARAVDAAGTSLGLAAGCVVLGWGGGMALGLLAAWRGGWSAAIVLRGADAMMAFPGLLLTLLVAGLLGGGALPLVLAVALAQLPQATRTAHALAAGVVALPFVAAARLASVAPSVILAKDVLPPLLPQLLTQAAAALAQAVLTLAGLSFLGIGLPPPTPEWGGMIAEAAPFLAEAPWMAMAPAGLLVATVLGLNLLVDAPA